MKKITALLTAALLVLSLAACGSSSSTASTETAETLEAADVPGTSYTWGSITVTVPEGMVTTNGAIGDPEDPDSLWVQDEGNMTHYFLINVSDEENAKMSIEGTKSVNDGEDVAPFDVNGITWQGVQYDYEGDPCWSVYGTTEDGTVFLVGSYAYDLTSPEATAILSTVAHS